MKIIIFEPDSVYLIKSKYLQSLSKIKTSLDLCKLALARAWLGARRKMCRPNPFGDQVGKTKSHLRSEKNKYA